MKNPIKKKRSSVFETDIFSSRDYPHTLRIFITIDLRYKGIREILPKETFVSIFHFFRKYI